MQRLVTCVLILGCFSPCLCLRQNVGTKNTLYNVIQYGARRDGKSDDSQAFLKAWNSACGAEGIPTLLIPPGKSFMVTHLILDGMTCKATSIHIQLQGKIVAPSKAAWIAGQNWITIQHAKKLLIDGNGGIDGDDCIALNSGSTYINVTRVACGPGHGISIGSLGRNQPRAIVEGVYVRNCTFIGTSNGARIKTENDGSGYARGITFEHIQLIKVINPIIIDQPYTHRLSHGTRGGHLSVTAGFGPSEVHSIENRAREITFASDRFQSRFRRVAVLAGGYFRFEAFVAFGEKNGLAVRMKLGRSVKQNTEEEDDP